MGLFSRRSVTLAKPETAMKRGDLVEEVGGTGTAMWGGVLIQQDYNGDLDSSRMYDVYDRMRKSDGTVRAGLNVVKLPLLAAKWSCEPASDQPQDVEIADMVEDNLLNKMSSSWHSTLRHILLSLDYGSMPFEKVWELSDGKLVLRKLAPRMPRTIVEWLVDDTGGYAGFKQSVFRSSGEYVTVTIPSEKSLVFINELEGSDFRGTSVLRAAYKHWYMKDRMYIIDAISQEKRGLGVDVAHIGENITPDQRSRAERAMMSIRSHEKNYLVEPEWMTYRVEGLGRGASRDGLPSIEHHDLQILRSILAEFIAMGSGGGSLAMHKDKSSFFLMALEAIAFMVTDTINRYLIPQMVSYNWPGVTDFPKFVHSRLDTRDTQALAQAVSTLVTAGVLTPDNEVEAALRQLLDLPDMPGDQPERDRTPAATSGSTAQQDGPVPVSASRVRHYTKRREPQFTTGGVRVDFGAMKTLLDAAEEKVVAAMREVQVRQIAVLQRIAGPLVEEKKWDKIGDVTIPYKQEMADAGFNVLKTLYEAGQSEVQKELSHQDTEHVLIFEGVDPGDSASVLAFLMFKSRALASLFADRLKSTFVWETLAQSKAGKYDSMKLGEALNGLSERESRKIARGSISEAFNFGRSVQAEKNADKIRKVEYSALMDDGTCGPCERADGKIFQYGSPEQIAYLPPYKNCEGKGNCRCIQVFIMSR